jgi:hypothetical protein
MKLDLQEPLILLQEVSPAKTLVLLDDGLDWMVSEVDYSSTHLLSQRMSKQKLSSWKTCQDFFQATKVATSEQSSLHWPTQGIATSSGVFLTRNSLEYPNDAEESSLSQILEENPSERYSLSQKAAQGILRRAINRGKKLPEMLSEALVQMAQEQETLNSTTFQTQK